MGSTIRCPRGHRGTLLGLTDTCIRTVMESEVDNRIADLSEPYMDHPTRGATIGRILKVSLVR